MTEVERLRAALEEIRGVKLLTDCGIHPMRAAGIRHAFEITAEIATKALSGEPTDSGHETTAKPTDSELYSSSELFRHIWVCPMGWIGDKLIYGPGYTSADMKPWLVKLRRLVGFEHPEGTPLEQPEKASGEPTDAEKRAMGVDLDSRDHEAR